MRGRDTRSIDGMSLKHDARFVDRKIGRALLRPHGLISKGDEKVTIVQWLPGSIGVFVMLGAAFWSGRLGFRAVSATSWPSVPGKIIRSVLEPVRQRGARARIRYEYRVGAQKLTGHTVFFGDFIETNAALAGEQVNAHPVGREVTVRHHPTEPQLACLEPRADVRVWLAFGGALVMASVILNAIARGE